MYSESYEGKLMRDRAHRIVMAIKGSGILDNYEQTCTPIIECSVFTMLYTAHSLGRLTPNVVRVILQYIKDQTTEGLFTRDRTLYTQGVKDFESFLKRASISDIEEYLESCLDNIIETYYYYLGNLEKYNEGVTGEYHVDLLKKFVMDNFHWYMSSYMNGEISAEQVMPYIGLVIQLDRYEAHTENILNYLAFSEHYGIIINPTDLLNCSVYTRDYVYRNYANHEYFAQIIEWVCTHPE